MAFVYFQILSPHSCSDDFASNAIGIDAVDSERFPTTLLKDSGTPSQRPDLSADHIGQHYIIVFSCSDFRQYGLHPRVHRTGNFNLGTVRLLLAA